MDPTAVDPIFVAIPILLGLVLLAVLGWQRRKDVERARVARLRELPLPEGAAAIRGDGTGPALRETLVGSYMLVAVGTYGTNQLVRLLTLLAGSGLERLVGSCLIIENDAQLRTQAHGRIPTVFADRLTYGWSDAFSGGLANEPVAWVLDHIDRWGVPIAQAANEAIDLHLRRNGSRAPSDILFFLSQGGHAPLGLPVLERLQDKFEEPLKLGLTSLPIHEDLRDRFAELKAEYERRGLFGWVVSDNLGPDLATADYGMVALIAALSDAALHADAATRLNNSFKLALSRERGGVLAYQVVAESVVGYRLVPDPTVPPRYYVWRDATVREAAKVLRRLEEGRGTWSVELPVGEAGRSVFDILVASLFDDVLRAVEDDVRAGRELRAKQLGGRGGGSARPLGLFGQPNYATLFAALGTRIDPERPICPIVGVRLAAITNGARLTDELVKVPGKRVPREPRPRLGGNGHHPIAAIPVSAPPDESEG